MKIIVKLYDDDSERHGYDYGIYRIDQKDFKLFTDLVEQHKSETKEYSDDSFENFLDEKEFKYERLDVDEKVYF